MTDVPLVARRSCGGGAGSAVRPVRLHAFALRRSSFERALNVVGELRVLLAALVDDLVQEVPWISHCVTVADDTATARAAHEV